jgi:hypothetical protein
VRISGTHLRRARALGEAHAALPAFEHLGATVAVADEDRRVAFLFQREAKMAADKARTNADFATGRAGL